MARALRIDYPGAWHHVVHRGIGRADIFGGDHDRSAFIDLLGEMDERFGFEIRAYVLMSNHYHLLGRSTEGVLSRSMRHLNGVYTQRYNWHHDRDGALLAGRFHSSLIEADTYLTRVARYIHLNPVSAGLVVAPEAYRWSSYPGYLNPSCAPGWLQRDRVLDYFDGSRVAHHRFVTSGAADGELDALERGAPPAVLGSVAFVQESSARREPHPETAAHRNRLRERPSLDQIDAAVAAAFGVSDMVLRSGQRGWSNAARLVAGHLAAVVGGAPHAVVRDRYGYATTRTATAALGRLRQRLAQDEALRRRVELIGCSLGSPTP